MQYEADSGVLYSSEGFHEEISTAWCLNCKVSICAWILRLDNHSFPTKS